ncbi:GNAT family N-acetyltransferase [Blautia marasmi]|uniref:GNAT family N-acetyltransferase n=1 Tax=Blautia marasmi TaxID=1917868 RepID=UPI003AB9A718
MKPHPHLYVTNQTSPTLLRSYYRYLGFTDTDSEQITHGIRNTPMESHILQ